MPEAAETPTDYGQTQVEIAGFEPPHQESCPIGPSLSCGAKRGSKSCAGLPAGVHDLHKARHQWSQGDTNSWCRGTHRWQVVP